MTVGIYIRVSHIEQVKEGYSISAQKERNIAYCIAQGWTDYKLYVDEGISAKDTHRPQLQLLMEHVKEGKIKTILVYKLDRFTRSVSDLYTLLDELDKYNCSFVSASENYDTSNAMGRMFIGLVALLAQWERENLSERVKMGLEEKVSSGERVGNVPYGFDLNEKEKLVPNEKAAVILDMIEKIKNGMSANALAAHLTKTNSDREVWHPTAVYRILQNPALYGATRWNDKVYENTHDGIVTKDEFMKLQNILNNRKTHRMREVKSIYLFQGVIACPTCGNTLSVNRFKRKRKDGSERWGNLYKCQVCWNEGRKMTSVGELRLLEALYRYMKDITIKDIQPPVPQKDESSEYKKQLSMIERRRTKYQKAWSMDLIDDDEFTKLMNETKGIYEELKKKIKETKPSVPTFDTEELKNIVFTFNEHFRHLALEDKRAFVSRFIRRIEFQLVPQPPKDKRYKKGKDLLVITNIDFY